MSNTLQQTEEMDKLTLSCLTEHRAYGLMGSLGGLMQLAKHNSAILGHCFFDLQGNLLTVCLEGTTLKLKLAVGWRGHGRHRSEQSERAEPIPIAVQARNHSTFPRPSGFCGAAKYTKPMCGANGSPQHLDESRVMEQNEAR